MDMNKLTQKSQEAVQNAQACALEYGHQEVDGEHLLQALLVQESGLLARLLLHIDASTSAILEAVQRDLEKRPKVSGPGIEAGKIYVTNRLQKLLNKAEKEAAQLKDEYVSVEHLSLALADEGGDSASARILREHGVSRDALLASMTRSVETSG
jgi:ATP-dependent Clp protease ATP-binding subunit ClpB